MPKFKSILHEGCEYSIAHLAPVSFECPCPQIGRNIRIGAVFLNHCYTEKFESLLHRKEQILLYDSGSRPRVFSPMRHQLSYRLPGAISALPGKRVHQTAQRRNYVYAVPLMIENAIYEIFFMLQRAENMDGIDLRLTVESAYAVDAPSPLPKRPNAIRFNLLAYKVLRREPIRFAPR